MEELDFRLHVIFLKRWRIYIFCGGGKEGKYLEKGKIFGEEKIFVGEETGGKGGKYLEKKKIIFGRRRRTEREKEANIWRRKEHFCGGEEKRRRKRRQISWRSKIRGTGGHGQVEGSTRGPRGPNNQIIITKK